MITRPPSPSRLCRCGARRDAHPVVDGCQTWVSPPDARRRPANPPRSRVDGRLPRTTAQARLVLGELLDANREILDPETRMEMALRPRTRADCVGGQRPCPWAGCRHHLALDVTDAGSLKVYRDDLEAMPDTCSLDVADRSEGVTLETVAQILGLTREAVRLIERRALAVACDKLAQH